MYSVAPHVPVSGVLGSVRADNQIMNTHAQVSRVVTQVGTPSQKFGSSQSVLGIPTVVQVTFCTGMQIH